VSETQQASESASTPDTFESRVHAVTEMVREEDASVEQASREAVDAPPAAAGPDPVETARAERRARIAKWSSEEAQKVDRRAPLAEHDQAARRAEEFERRAKDLEAQLASRIDPSSLDEAALFNLFQTSKVSPQKLGEWIRDSISNPETLAATAAQRALDPRITAAEERALRAEQQVQEFIASQQRREAETAEKAAAREFVSAVTPDAAPRASAFLSTFGEGEFLKVAYSAAASLPQGAGHQALLDEIEETLDKFASAFTSNGKQNQTPTHAAAKATTVSNSVAQQRASVLEEDDFASLPFEERVRRVRTSA
jgi:hypothetical protein